MITVENLLDAALVAETVYKDRAAKFGPGTVDEIRNGAKREMLLALFCAAEMEKSGVKEANAFGPFGLQNISRGVKVRLKAGAHVRSTHPKYRGIGYANPKNRTVEVFDTYQGFANPNAHRSEPSLRHPQIVWVGTGGYWFYADINDVELI